MCVWFYCGARIDLWEFSFGDFIFIAVGLPMEKLCPISLRNISLKDSMFLRNYPNFLNQNKSCLVLKFAHQILLSNTKVWSTDTATWMNLKNMILRERNLTQKSIYCLIPFRWISGTRKINQWWRKGTVGGSRWWGQGLGWWKCSLS